MTTSRQMTHLDGPERYEEIPIEAIDISPFNVRKDLNAGQEEADIDDLARSIAQDGLLQAPIVREATAGRFELIIGQRRFMACQKLGKSPIRVRVVEVSDSGARILSLVENTHRASMSPMDTARTYQAILDELGTVEAVSQAVKVSPRVVENRLKLLKLAPSLQKQLSTSGGTEGISAYEALGENFAPEDQADAWRATGGLLPSQAARILKHSGGDFEKLSEEKDRTLAETLDVKFCGNSAESCPYIPASLRARVARMVEEFERANS